MTLDGVRGPVSLLGRLRAAVGPARGSKVRISRDVRGAGCIGCGVAGLGRDDRGQWLGDAWDNDGAGTNAAADFTTSALGWGVLAFAVGTAALRGYSAVRRATARTP